MGGHGTARIGFKNPGLFTAMAAMESAVMPAHELADVPPANMAFQARNVIVERYGSPPDEYWNRNIRIT